MLAVATYLHDSFPEIIFRSLPRYLLQAELIMNVYVNFLNWARL